MKRLLQISLVVIALFIFSCTPTSQLSVTSDQDTEQIIVAQEQQSSSDISNIKELPSDILPSDISVSEREPEEPEEELSIEEKHWNRLFEKALAPVDCPTPPLRQWSDSDYQGHMIDAHIHIHSFPDG